MACRQACNPGYSSPVDGYLTRNVANDNRPRWTPPEWIASTFGIVSCCTAQFAWSAFLVAQISS